MLRVNHVGDWGTQFGMLITYLLEHHPHILEGLQDDGTYAQTHTSSDLLEMESLTAIYKASKMRFDQDESFKERSRKNVVSLQAGDPTCKKIWLLLCARSREEFQRVYDILGVSLTEMGESFYNPYLQGVIEELTVRGLVQEDQGMKVVKIPSYPIPLILQKSDGGFGYDTTDAAALKFRLLRLRVDWVVIITDAGQQMHFHMTYALGREAGWLRDQRDLFTPRPVKPPLPDVDIFGRLPGEEGYAGPLS
ncbi:arginine--tRNA ligase, partial [archaeon]